jgi:hypothetical protein
MLIKRSSGTKDRWNPSQMLASVEMYASVLSKVWTTAEENEHENDDSERLIEVRCRSSVGPGDDEEKLLQSTESPFVQHMVPLKLRSFYKHTKSKEGANKSWQSSAL